MAFASPHQKIRACETRGLHHEDLREFVAPILTRRPVPSPFVIYRLAAAYLTLAVLHMAKAPPTRLLDRATSFCHSARPAERRVSTSSDVQANLA